MPILNWKNVTGSSNNAGTGALKNAGDLFNKAFDNAESRYQGKQDKLVSDNDAEIANQIKLAKNPEEVRLLREQLDGDMLNQTYGPDNYTKQKAYNLLDTEGPRLLKEQQAATDRNTRITDANTARTNAATTFGQQQAEVARTNAARTLTEGVNADFNSLPSYGQVFANNQQVSLATAEQINSEIPGSFIPNSEGDIDPGPNYTDEAGQRFETTRRENGVKNLPSFEEQRVDLRALISKRDPEGKFTPDQYTAIEANLFARHGSAKLGKLKQQDLDKRTKAISDRSTVAIARIDKQLAFDLSQNPLDTPLSPKARTASFNDLIDELTAEGKSDDETILFNYVGGTEVAELVQSLANANPNLSAEELEGIFKPEKIGGGGWHPIDEAYKEADIIAAVAQQMQLPANQRRLSYRTTLENNAANTKAKHITDAQTNVDNEVRQARIANRLPHEGRYSKFTNKSRKSTSENVASLKKAGSTQKADTPVNSVTPPPTDTTVESLKASTAPVKAALKDVNLFASNNIVQKSIRKYLKDTDLTGTERIKVGAELTKAANTYRDDAEDLGDLKDKLKRFQTRRAPASQGQITALKKKIASSTAALELLKQLLQPR